MTRRSNGSDQARVPGDPGLHAELRLAASHDATTSSNSNALPLGARLRLKASKSLSGYTPEVQRIFQAMKTYGLIVADNGSDMYITGAYDTRWNNDV